jgi:hypothetical protein
MSDGLIEGGDERQTGGTAATAFRPSRRKVLTVAAWTVPVVIIGTAAPALAASSSPVEFQWNNPCFHTSGTHQDSLHIPLTVTNTYNSTISLQVRSVTVNGIALTTIDQSRNRIEARDTEPVVVHAGKLDAQPVSVVIVITYDVVVGNQTTRYTVTSPSLPVTACSSGLA